MMQKTKPDSLKAEDGLSLIQMAIALTVIGLLAGGFLQQYDAYMQVKSRTKERTLQEKITNNLAVYLQQNGHYPCPAAPNLQYRDENFGKAGACTGGVSQGALPVRDLNLPLEMMADNYGSKFTYAVTTGKAAKSSFGTTPDGITITNPQGLTKTVPFVIVMHGEDKKGAYPLDGTTIAVPCGTSAKDAENCNGDASFHDGLYAPVNNINSASRYDDTLVYSLAQRATTLWLLSPHENGLSIANRNKGNVGIGTNTPDAKLTVHNGDVNVHDAGASASGDILTSGKIEANTGSQIHAKKAIDSTGSIYTKENARANDRMVAERFCYNIQLSECR